MKSKKAMLFSVLLVLTFFIVATSAFIVLDRKYTELSRSKQIGEKQMALFDAYGKGEKAMFYIDRAAEIAAEEAVYDLAETGGHFNSPCGYYGNDDESAYAVWKRNDQDCYPGLSDSYESLFNAEISKYISLYPEKNVRMPTSFTLSLSSNLGGIIGTANTDLIIGMGEEPLLGEFGSSGQCGIDIVNEARKYLGTTYNLGSGGDINTFPPKAIDCSHMTWRAYYPSISKYNLGISNSYCTSRCQAGKPGEGEGWGRVVDGNPNQLRYSCPDTGIEPNLNNLQPGDLLFFACTFQREVPNQVSHVGIYAGDGKVIHCGHPCKECDLMTNCGLKEYYVGARRVCPVESRASGGGSVIVIDPGHGSAVNKRPCEDDIMLQIGLKLKSALERKGYTVVMTRTTTGQPVGGIKVSGEDDDNRQRAKIANNAKASLFLRLHSDDPSTDKFMIAYPAKQATLTAGGETKTGPSTSVIEASKKAAQKIHDVMVSKGFASKQGSAVTEDGYYNTKGRGVLIGSIYSEVPVATIEMYGHGGDSCASSSYKKYKNNEGNIQDKIAQAIADGIESAVPLALLPKQGTGAGTIGSGKYETEVYVIQGSSPGPTVTIIGGMHGNEKAGYTATESLLKKSIDKGTIYVIPRSNKPAISAGERDAGVDLNRAFTKQNLEAKSPSDIQKLTQDLYSYMQKSDYVINLHEYSGGYYIDYKGTGKDIAGRTIQAAKGYGIAEKVANKLNDFVSTNKLSNPNKKWLPFKQPAGTTTTSYVEDKSSKTQHFFVETCCYSNPAISLNERVQEQEAAIKYLLQEFRINYVENAR